MILNVLQIIIAVILTIIILIQNRGTGLGSTFGGEGSIYRTKRGLEKSLHVTTIILSIIFLVIAFINVLY